jgi:hypothetical protein
LLECAVHIGLAALTVASWLGLGTLVLAPLRPLADRPLSLLNRVGAGAVTFGLLTFAVALVDGVYRAVYLPAFVAAAASGIVLAARELREFQRPRLRAWRGWELALGALVCGYVVLELVVTCAPISSADALLHHAAAPELYARVHEYRELPWTWNSYQPYMVEMLILDGLLLHGLEQGAFAPLLLGFGSLAAVAGGAYRLLGRRGAFVAAAVFWAQPFTAWIATSTFVEPGGAFFIALAAWNLIEFARRGSTTALVLIGVFAGAAAGTKYFAAAAAAVLCVVGAIAVRDRLTLRRVAIVAGTALAVAAPWYVKNAVLTGDPLYPLVRGWPNDDARRAALESIDNYGFGTSAADLVALPFRLLGDAQPFDRGEFMSPLILLFAPVALLARRGRREIALALAGSTAFVLMWFFGAQHARFLLPAFPVFAVLAAVGILAFAEAGRLARLATVAVCSGALLAGLGITLVYSAQFVPVAFGLESREQFLRENTPYYDGLEWLNEHEPGAKGVLLDHVLVLYADAPAVAWTADALPSNTTPRELREFVRRDRITHAEVFAASRDKRRLLEAIGARRIGRVTVHDVRSRTLSELGPPQTMIVYELPQG